LTAEKNSWQISK